MAVPVYFLFAYVFEGILNELIPFMPFDFAQECVRQAFMPFRVHYERNQLVQGIYGASVIDKPLNGSYRAWQL
jgi:hypothetical protein